MKIIKNALITLSVFLVVAFSFALLFKDSYAISDGVINNTTLTGNYEDLYLKANTDNTFEWTGDFRIYVQPMWRCL